ncbi:MAG: hypothetical protein FJW90_07055 [Actinobacteria bacterium]|nr:hypothetical protein [Actinomycetota bacterium]
MTLELSAIFHRDEGAQAARAGWPSIEQARRWGELDPYLEGCPYPGAIRACRARAEDVAATREEIWATLVGSAIRQFWFDNTDKQLAAALVEAGSERLGAPGSAWERLGAPGSEADAYVGRSPYRSVRASPTGVSGEAIRT